MRKVILSFSFCASFLSAQSQPSASISPADQTSLMSRQMEIFLRSAQGGDAAAQRKQAEKRAAELARTEFLDKANHFVELWSDFATLLNEKQTFDAKLAKKVSKAFHELEKTDGWPVREQTK